MKKFEVRNAQGEVISKRASIQFARSDANKVEGATIHEVVPQIAEGKVAYTWKFPVA